MQTLISGSVVLYKSNDSVILTIKAFLNTSLPVKLFLVDNSPTDELRNKLSEYVNDERVEYIFNNANIGFGAAHNVAIRKIIDETPYHLVLNPDISFMPGVLEALYDYMTQHWQVGLVMPKIMYPNGEMQYSCKLLPTPADLIF